MKAEKMVYKLVEMHEIEADKLIDAINEVDLCVRTTAAPPEWVLKMLIELRDKLESL